MSVILRTQRAVSAAAVALLLSACSGKEPTATVRSGPSPSQATTTECPKPAAASFQWPAGIPANFPKPPGGRLVGATTRQDGLRIVRLTTGLGLRDGILFVLEELPRAGFTLGRGDAEAAEADAPFRSADVRGVVRLVATGKACETTWLVAAVPVGATGTAPFSPFPRPSATSSLPFG